MLSQIPEHLGQPLGVGLQGPRRHRLDANVALPEKGQIPFEVFEELVELHRPRPDQLAGLRACEREHVVDQPVHLVDLAQEHLDHAPALPGAFADSAQQLRLAAHDRERGP